jgi:hypothetical protein
MNKDQNERLVQAFESIAGALGELACCVEHFPDSDCSEFNTYSHVTVHGDEDIPLSVIAELHTPEHGLPLVERAGPIEPDPSNELDPSHDDFICPTCDEFLCPTCIEELRPRRQLFDRR